MPTTSQSRIGPIRCFWIRWSMSFELSANSMCNLPGIGVALHKKRFDLEDGVAIVHTVSASERQDKIEVMSAANLYSETMNLVPGILRVHDQGWQTLEYLNVSIPAGNLDNHKWELTLKALQSDSSFLQKFQSIVFRLGVENLLGLASADLGIALQNEEVSTVS
eukprot:g10668.t1